MNVNEIGAAGCPAWWEAGWARRSSSGTSFADRIGGVNAADAFSSHRSGVSATGQSFVLEAYQASASSGMHNIKSSYNTYESENYRIVPDNEAGCFDIYNKQGEKLGVFNYSDIKIRQDSATGTQLLISAYGTGSFYDAIVMDNELKEDLQNAMGVSTLEMVELKGFTLKTHFGTGIQYLVRDGEEGRGGKVLLQNQADIEKYEALAETYFNKYPNLVHDKNAGYIWADLEIKGLAQHTDNGIISLGYDGMSYNDNSDYKNNWNIFFSTDAYKTVFDWLQSNKENIEEMQKSSIVETIFAKRTQNEVKASQTSNVDTYRKYLESKYGRVTIKDVPKDQKTLEKLGKSMSGNDVVIAPNILEEMANDPQKAAYYEQKIDYFFDTIIPRETARCASMGLVFEPAGVVVHKDGTVTYICGCSDSPERVAQVNAINKAKREKRAARREAAFERGREEAARRAQEIELSARRHSIEQTLADYSAQTWDVQTVNTTDTGISMQEAYERLSGSGKPLPEAGQDEECKEKNVGGSDLAASAGLPPGTKVTEIAVASLPNGVSFYFNEDTGEVSCIDDRDSRPGRHALWSKILSPEERERVYNQLFDNYKDVAAGRFVYRYRAYLKHEEFWDMYLDGKVDLTTLVESDSMLSEEELYNKFLHDKVNGK